MNNLININLVYLDGNLKDCLEYGYTKNENQKTLTILIKLT